jgi:hypothetical protein
MPTLSDHGLHQTSTRPPPHADIPIVPSPTQGASIVVVEDERVIADAVAARLRKEGLQVDRR